MGGGIFWQLLPYRQMATAGERNKRMKSLNFSIKGYFDEDPPTWSMNVL